jgi:hypothetical protein
MMDIYDAKKNSFLKNAKDLVPRIVIYDDAFLSNSSFGFCLVEKKYPKTYYCFLSMFGFMDKDRYCIGDVIKKLSFEDYFKISNRLRLLNIKFNLKKIIYDSNRNK